MQQGKDTREMISRIVKNSSGKVRQGGMTCSMRCLREILCFLTSQLVHVCVLHVCRTTRSSAITNTNWRLATPRTSLKSSLESPTTWMLLWSAPNQIVMKTLSSSSRVGMQCEKLLCFDDYEGELTDKLTILPAGDDIYHFNVRTKAVDEKEFKSMPNCTSAFRFMEHYYCFHGHMFSKFDPKTGEVHGRYPKEARDYFMRCSKFSKLNISVHFSHIYHQTASPVLHISDTESQKRYVLVCPSGEQSDHVDRERCSRVHLDAITSDDAGNIYAFRGEPPAHGELFECWLQLFRLIPLLCRPPLHSQRRGQ